MNLKIIFANKILISILFVMIIFSIWQHVKMQSIFDSNSKTTEQIHKINYMDSSLNITLSNAEGLKTRNIVLRNIHGNNVLSDFFRNKNYCIIIFQNGIVCDPCLEFVDEYWKANSNNYPKALSNQLIIIGDKNDRSTFIYMKKNHLENSYFIDINRQISKDLSLNNLPANFLFLLDNKQRVIWADYFTPDTKNKFDNFIRKSVRFIENEK